ncbi:MAG TPA: Hsp20/alpha crystallin family protein [Pirellulales bacterium]|nr:Hsp20/alpha crystallin family protein [Pirellulales bacterium]
MSLIPWRNKHQETQRGDLAPLSEFRREVDRLFDSFLREPFAWPEWGFSSPWNPSLDVRETDDAVMVRAEVPGVKPDDINISVAGNVLVLSGEKKEAEEKQGNGVRHSERRFGSFRREISLPAGIDADQVTADYAHGVLTVKIAKSPEAAPKRIPVTVSN